MVYPFLMMLGISVESQYDQTTYSLVPQYLYSAAPALFGKYAEDKYRADMGAIDDAYGTGFRRSCRMWFRRAPVIDPAGMACIRRQRCRARFKSVGFGGATGVLQSESPA